MPASTWDRSEIVAGTEQMFGSVLGPNFVLLGEGTVLFLFGQWLV